MTKQERETLKDLTQLGEQYNCAVTLARRSGNCHPIWEIRHRKTGRTRMYVTSSSSCSNSGRLNALAAIKRIMRQLAVPVPK